MSDIVNTQLLELAAEHISRGKHRKAIIKGDVAYIPLGVDGKYGYTTVDVEYAWLDKFKWTLGKNGYATKDPNKPLPLLHNCILGKSPKGFLSDHINRDRLDNRTCNLRFITATDSIVNTNIRKDNKSGYKGINWDSSRNSWRVAFTYKDVKINNYRKNIQDAIKLRLSLEEVYHV